MVTLWVGDAPGLLAESTWALLITNSNKDHSTYDVKYSFTWLGIRVKKKKRKLILSYEGSFLWAQPLRIIIIWIKRERDWGMAVQTAWTLAAIVRKPLKKHCSRETLLLPLPVTWPLEHAQGSVSSPVSAGNNNKLSCGSEGSVKWCRESSYFDAFEGLSGSELLLQFQARKDRSCCDVSFPLH